MHKEQTTDENGFTIVELIVAMILFGIVVITVGMLINVLTQMNNYTSDTVTATSIVQNKVESLRSKGYNSVPVGTVDFSSELPATLPQPRSAQYVISQVSLPTRSITVTITYGGKSHVYTTFIGELGVAQY
ncbi:MAG: type IV pilus modification PilV family protein [Acidobacteriota bacterium]